MAYGLTFEDSDPIYRTSQQARRALPVYNGGGGDTDAEDVPAVVVPKTPLAAIPTQQTAASAPAPGGPDQAMLAAGYEPVTFAPQKAGIPGAAPATMAADPAMIAAGYEPVSFNLTPAGTDSIAGGFQQQWQGTKGGLLGAVGAVAHSTGLTGVEQWAKEGSAAADKAAQAAAGPSSSFSDVLEGKEGSSWTGYGKNIAGNILEVLAEGAATSLATAAAGSVFGPVGTVAGGVTGLVGGVVNAVARNTLFRTLTERAIGFEAKKLGELAAKEGIKVTAEQVNDQAARNILKYAVIGGAISEGKNTGVETGMIFNQAVEESEKTGKPIDMAKVYGYGLGAGLMETAGEFMGVSSFLRVGKGASRMSNALRGLAATSLTEGGTEGVQTILERIGAGQNTWGNVLTDPDSRRDIIDSMAAGATIGGVIGGVGGGLHGVHKPGEAAPGVESLPAEDISATLGARVGGVPELPAPVRGMPDRSGDVLNEEQRQQSAALEQRNNELWQARDAEQARLQALTAAHDTGQHSGNARADVEAAIADITGAVQGTTQQKGGAKGLQQDTTAAAPTQLALNLAPGAETTTEPTSDINAQIEALKDPNSPKDAMFIAKGTPMPGKGEWPKGVQRIHNDDGVYLTNNPDKLALVSGRKTLTDQERATFLGIPEGKGTTVAKSNAPVVVSAKDAKGNVVAQAATTPAGPNVSAVKKQTPKGGTTVLQTPADALAERQSKVDAEQKGAPLVAAPVATEAPGATKAKAASKKLAAAAAAPTVEGGKNAQTVRGDQGQAGEGGKGKQPGVQPGADVGSENLQRTEETGTEAGDQKGRKRRVNAPIAAEPTMTIAGKDMNDEPGTLKVWVTDDKIKRAELHSSDGGVMVVSTKSRDTLAHVLTRVEDDFTPAQKEAPATTTEPTETDAEKKARIAKEREASLKNLRRKVRAAGEGEEGVTVIAADAPREQREAFVNQHLAHDWNTDHSVTLVDTPTKWEKMAKVLGDLLGQNIQFFSPANKQISDAIDGFKVPGDPHTVYVNINNQKPALFIIGHEIGHNIRELRPKLWSDFMNVVSTVADRKEFAKYLHGMKIALEREAVQRGETKPTLPQIGATTLDEVSADAMGTAFMDPKFWDRLYNSVLPDQRPIVLRMMEEVAALLKRFAMALSGQKEVSTVAGKMFTDTRELHRAVRDLIVNFRENGPKKLTATELREEAARYYDQNMEPDTENTKAKEYAWADLSKTGKDYWVNVYDDFRSGDLSGGELLNEFDHINATERRNERVEGGNAAVARSTAYMEAETLWNEKMATAKDPDFEDLQPDHKNHFIRAVYDSAQGKKGASPTAAYDQIKSWIKQDEAKSSTEEKRLAAIEKAKAKEAAAAAAAEAKAAKTAAEEKKRLADIAKAMKKEMPAIKERMKNLSARDQEIIARHFGATTMTDKIAHYLSAKVADVVLDPKNLVRDLPEDIRPVIRRIVGGSVKYSRAAFGMEQSEQKELQDKWEAAAIAAATREQNVNRVIPKITSTGRIVGAPPGANTPTHRARLVQRLTRYMEHEYSVYDKAKNWYEDSGAEIARLTEGNPALREALIRMTAYYSQGVQVGANTTFSIRAIMQAIRGEDIHSGIYPNMQSPRAQAILKAKTMDTSLEGVDNKLMNFYRNLHDATTGEDTYDNASTLDRWMMRLFGYKHSQDADVGGAQAMSTPQYEYGKDVMHRVADAWERQTGERLKPRQVQAVLWTYIKNRDNAAKQRSRERTAANNAAIFRMLANNTTDPETKALLTEDAEKWSNRSTIREYKSVSQNYREYFRKAEARVLYEVRPSETLDVWPFTRGLSGDDMREFSNMVRALLIDPETGRDTLMEKSGIPMYSQSNGSTGSWDGAISPNFVSYVTQDKELGKAQGGTGEFKAGPVKVYADALGYLLRQDAVFWFRPAESGSKQGMTIRIPNMKEGVERTIYNLIKLEQPQGIEFTRDGNEVFFVNAAEDDNGKLMISNPRFKRIIENAVEKAAVSEDFTYEAIGFKTEANTHANDWKKNPIGEGYRDRLRAAGRSDLLPWLDRKRKEIEQLASGYALQRGERRPQYSRKSAEGIGRQQAEGIGLPDEGRFRGGAGVLDVASGTHPSLEPLKGLPAQVRVDGKLVTFGPHAPAIRAAQEYADKAGITYVRPDTYAKVDPAKGKRLADAYASMANVPDDPVVKEAYAALARETMAQWQTIKASTGLQVEFMEPGVDPYGNPRNAILDVVNNNHLWVYPTDVGYGQEGITEAQVASNPLLAMSGETISGHPARVNDIFRIVHDYFGHIKEGLGFRAEGEENAWRQHAAMFTDAALPALTSETRGQNSWVNFGPEAEHNRTANGGDTIYAEQKIGVMAPWTHADGREPGHAQRTERPRYSRKDSFNPIEVYALEGDRIVGMATFNVTNQTWFVYKALPGGDIRSQYTEHPAPDTESAMNMMRGKGVRLVRRKEGPSMQGQRDPWGRGPDVLFDLDSTPTPANNRFTKAVDWALSKTGLRGKGPEVRRNFIRKIQDSFIDVKQLQADIVRKGGVIDGSNNVYQKVTLFPGSTGQQMDQFRRNFVEPIEKAIQAALQKGATMLDIETYLIAEHAKERNDMIEKRTEGKKKDGSGMTTKDAEDNLKKYRNGPYATELAEIGRIADNISTFKVGLMERSGLISTETADGLRTYKHYRPLKSLDEDDSGEITGGLGVGTGFTGRGTLLKYATGRDTQAKHVISHLLLDAEAKIVRAGKNEVAKALYKLAEDHPDPKFWGTDVMKSRKVFNPETGTIRYQHDNEMTNPNIVMAWVNGEGHKVTMHDTSFAEAMTNAKAMGSDSLLEGLRRWNKYLAMMMTSLNPEWGLVNAVRDAQNAYFNIASDSRMPPGMGKKVMAELLALKGHKDILKAIKDPTNITGLGKWYKELEELGGITKFFGLETLKDRATKLADMENRLMNKGVKGKLREYYAKTHAEGMVKWMEDINAAVEAAPRVAAYKTLIESGKWSKEDAADYAKNLTVNFNRKGTQNELSSLYLFFNPAVQGTARLWEAVKTPQGKVIASSLFGLGFAAGILGNASGGDDDKDGIPDYQELSDWERSTNIIPFAHGIKIPLPYGWNAFYAMGNYLADTFFGRSPMAASWAGIKAAQNAFNPIGGSDSKSNMGWLVKQVTPTALDPALEYYANENRYGAAIRRVQDTRYGPKMPESASGSMQASATSKGLASGINALTGGSAAKSGAIDMNPDSIDFFFSSIAPGVLSSGARSLSTGKKMLAGEETETREYPVVRRVWTEPSKGKAYEALSDAKAQLGELKNMAKNGDASDRQDLSQNYPGWRGVDATFTVFGKQVGDLQKRKAGIIDGKIKVADEAAEKNKIDHRITELQAKMLQSYNTVSARW